MERIFTLFEAQMHIRSRSLDRALAKAGRRLPERARAAGARIVKALPLLEHPALQRQIDPSDLRRDMADLIAALEGYDRKGRRQHWWLGMATGLMFNLLALIAVLLAALKWRGLI